jgi:hypothetical protein
MEFSAGGYSYVAICDYHNMCTYMVNGVQETNLGLVLAFNVTSHQGQNETIAFQWVPMGPVQGNPLLPSPSEVSVFNNHVTFNWFTNGSRLYMSITTIESTAQTSFYASNVVFKYTKLPANFTVDGYSFGLVCNGECVINVHGTPTQYFDTTVIFNVTRSDQSQLMFFGWPPTEPTTIEPPVTSGSAYNGQVLVTWFTNSTGVYVIISAKS